MTDKEGLTPLILEENLTVMSAMGLFENLKTLKGQAAQLDASNVMHLDMPALQILLSAAKFWASEKLTFEITNISENFQMGLDTLGVDLSELNNAEAV